MLDRTLCKLFVIIPTPVKEGVQKYLEDRVLLRQWLAQRKGVPESYFNLQRLQQVNRYSLEQDYIN